MDRHEHFLLFLNAVLLLESYWSIDWLWDPGDDDQTLILIDVNDMLIVYSDRSN